MEYNITYRKKDNGIQAIISYKDNNGKWKQKSKQGFKTQKEAKPIIAKIVKDLEIQMLSKKNEINTNCNEITFKELFEEYTTHSKLYKEFATIKGYKIAFSSFSQIHNMQVCNLKRKDIIKCVDEMILRKVKYETIKSYLRRINTCFNYYKENYNSNFSIDLNIQLAKDKNNNEKKALTKIELNNLLSNKELLNSKFYIVAYIAAKTGLRCSEILGLTWNDINERDMMLIVNKQWKVITAGKSGFGTLKTKNSNRKVPITKNFLKELYKYKKNSVLSIDGRIAPFNISSIDKYLNPILKKIAGITLHELRHTFITILISNGIDFKTVAKIAGHDVEQTLKTYSHVNDEMMKNAINAIEKIF